jgi:hypothetical protein
MFFSAARDNFAEFDSAQGHTEILEIETCSIPRSWISSVGCFLLGAVEFFSVQKSPSLDLKGTIAPG